MYAEQMIAAHPKQRARAGDALAPCIEAAFDCAQVCVACADACLAEDMVESLRACITANLDCADVCLAAGRLASRRTREGGRLVADLLAVCEQACRRCAEECEAHAGRHEHCRLCAEACRACETACREAAAAPEDAVH